MREAVGGGMLMYALVPFFIGLIVFIASIMQYVKAYNVVNNCITKIEASENCSLACADVVQDIITVDNNTCRVRVTKKVEFEFPFFGKVSVFNAKAESKTIRIGA